MASSCTSKIVNGVYDGRVSCKDESTGNIVMEMSFSNGKQDGKRTIWNPKTKDLEQVSNWKNGVLNGEEKIYFNGKKLCETEYKNGKIHGKQVCWGAASYNDSLTHKNAYKRLETFKDDEKTIDAIFENDEIKNGLFTSAGWRPESDGITYWVTQQNISEGKRNGKQESFRVQSNDPMNRLPFASAEFKNGLPVGKFTWYAKDGKSICAEKTYENGSPVSGFLNIYANDNSLSSQVELVKHDTINAFVLNGNQKTIQKYKESKDWRSKDHCDYGCSTTETVWNNGVVLKTVYTDYVGGSNFERVVSMATQELIKESITGSPPNFHTLAPNSSSFCGDTSSDYVSDIAVIDHKLYTSRIVSYENNAPKTEVICPYGATDGTNPDSVLYDGSGCTEKSLVPTDNQDQDQDQEIPSLQ